MLKTEFIFGSNGYYNIKISGPGLRDEAIREHNLIANFISFYCKYIYTDNNVSVEKIIELITELFKANKVEDYSFSVEEMINGMMVLFNEVILNVIDKDKLVAINKYYNYEYIPPTVLDITESLLSKKTKSYMFEFSRINNGIYGGTLKMPILSLSDLLLPLCVSSLLAETMRRIERDSYKKLKFYIDQLNKQIKNYDIRKGEFLIQVPTIVMENKYIQVNQNYKNTTEVNDNIATTDKTNGDIKSIITTYSSESLIFGQDLENDSGKISFSNGSYYIGEIKNSKMNGNGTYYFIDSSKYIGEFKDDKIEGYGLLFNEVGDIVFDCIFDKKLNMIKETYLHYKSIDSQDQINIVEREFLIDNKFIKTSQSDRQDRMRICSMDYVEVDAKATENINLKNVAPKNDKSIDGIDLKKLEESSNLKIDKDNMVYKEIKSEYPIINNDKKDAPKWERKGIKKEPIINHDHLNQQSSKELLKDIKEYQKPKKISKIFRFISMIIGYFFLFIGALGFVSPFIYPFSMGSNGWDGAILSIPVGMFFLYLYLLDKPFKMRMYRIFRDLFICIAIQSLPGITTITVILIFLFSIAGAKLFDLLYGDITFRKINSKFKKVAMNSAGVIFLAMFIIFGAWLLSYVKNLEENKQKAISIIKENSSLSKGKDNTEFNYIAEYDGVIAQENSDLRDEMKIKTIDHVGKKTIKEVQTILKEQDIYTDEVDGILGIKTSAAIGYFQFINRLNYTGEINRETLDALGVEY